MALLKFLSKMLGGRPSPSLKKGGAMKKKKKQKSKPGKKRTAGASGSARKKSKRVKAKKSTVRKAGRKKSTARKPAASRVKAAKAPAVIGIVTHYFPHVNAAAVKLKKELTTGAEVFFKGHTTNFSQKIDSLQIDRVPVAKAKKGKEVGIEVLDRVRAGDKVLAV